MPGDGSAICRRCRARASASNGGNVPARDDILAALRAAAPAAAALPDLKGLRAVRYPDLKRRFMESVVEVGGRCVEVAGPLEAALTAVPEYVAARKVVSLVPGVAKANVDLAGAAAYLTQHLAVAVRADALVHNLHEAYERIGTFSGFAMFLSGPNDTADIEQALVIGAHGARSCTVLLTPSLRDHP